MARTLHQAMAYLGLGQVEDEAQRTERPQRHPETIYEETVFEADDQYDAYPDELAPAEGRAHISSTADRDVLLGISPEATGSRPAPEATAGSVSVAEADDQLLEQVESTGTDWDFPGTHQQASNYTSTALTPSFSEESSEELRRITTIHPRSYNDAKIIGESFRENIPVIMNVTDMGDTDAKRLIDFSAGLAFALNGHIERVTDKVFLLTPANLEVLGAEGTEVPVALDSDDVTPFNQA
ncbi:cell division protein SepF [Rothia nasimurium]|uniref:cell division protein SepF n=1 Tax=Rothia nasimurium TaxID=85336 RepID=UPI001F369FC9|nr:cell division protein SepF [Rothia nasimurium]